LAQLGFDLRTLAREIGNSTNLDSLGDLRFGEAERLLGQGKPEALPPASHDGFDPGDFVHRLWHYTWNWRNLSTIDRCYTPTFRWLGPSDRTLQGRGDLTSFVLSMSAVIPDLAVTVEDVYWRGKDREGYHVSSL